MFPRPSFSDRISESSELLSINSKDLVSDLKKFGITSDSTGESLLDAPTTTIEDLVSIMEVGCANGIPNLKLKAAASVLKGNSLVKKEIPESENRMPVVSIENERKTFAELLKEQRPIANWSDRELIERYAKDREHNVEQELNRRAKQQNFVVLKEGKFEPGKEDIDIEVTLDLLKSARKRTNPSTIPHGDKFVQVYNITELNPSDRIVELCPLCGESLYKGYCEKCHSNFAGVGDDERAFAKLVADSDNFSIDSRADRRDVVISAKKGLDDLKLNWPSLIKEFDDLKLTGNLPKLRIILNRPATVADPFFQNGNRAFGHNEY